MYISIWATRIGFHRDVLVDTQGVHAWMYKIMISTQINAILGKPTQNLRGSSSLI